MPNANGFKYPGETDEEAAVRRAAQAKWRREQRASWPPEKRAAYNAHMAAYHRKKHAEMSPEKRKAKSKRNVERNRRIYLNMSPQEKTAFLEAARRASKKRRDALTEQQRRFEIARTYEYKKRRLREDPAFRIGECLRNRVYCVLRGLSKSKASFELTGADFISVIRSRLKPGMTMQNYGKTWHVDHVVPCRWFDLTDPLHQRACFHHSNMQPEYAERNVAKMDRVSPEDIKTVMARCPAENVPVFAGILARVEAGEYRGRIRRIGGQP